MKEKSPIDEQTLKKEVNDVYDTMIILQKDAEWNLKRILQMNKTYSEEKLATMTFEERKKVIREAETLFNRLRINAEELIKVDKMQEKLRQKANEFYGEEVLPPTKPLKLPSFDLNKIMDEGEEWKQEN